MDKSIENNKYPRLLTLIVTERCNLDCTYCFEKNKKDREMSLETAVEAVERHLDSDTDEYDHVQIDFTGGEPLMNFNLIREVVDYVVSRKWKKTFDFSIGTNGTLIDEEIRDWASKHPCVAFGLSFDGIKEAQDINRSGSYDKVLKNIDFFKKRSEEAQVKMTIGPESIDKVAEGIMHIHELGMLVTANVVFEDVWGEKQSEYLKTFGEQLEILIEFYHKNPHLEPALLLNIPIEALLLPKDESSRYCGSGKNMRTVDVEGIEYPCHRFTPLASSNPAPNPSLEFKPIEPEKCRNCRLIQICPVCIGYCYEIYSDVNHRTAFHCEFIKLQAMATAKLRYLKLKDNQKINSPESCSDEEGAEIRRTVDSILYVNNYLRVKSSYQNLHM